MSLKSLQTALREVVVDVHSRTCPARSNVCECGVGAKSERLIRQAANRIDDLEAEVAALKLTLKTV